MGERIYRTHARKRMRQRGITQDDVECALRREIRRKPGEPGTIWIYGASTEGRILGVCVTTDRSVVITTAWPDEKG